MFDIFEYKSTLNDSSSIIENGIGASNGNIYVCHPWAATLDDAYLRFSGIILDKNDVRQNKKINVIDMNFPGIIVLQTGASFFY